MVGIGPGFLEQCLGLVDVAGWAGPHSVMIDLCYAFSLGLPEAFQAAVNEVEGPGRHSLAEGERLLIVCGIRRHPLVASNIIAAQVHQMIT